MSSCVLGSLGEKSLKNQHVVSVSIAAEIMFQGKPNRANTENSLNTNKNHPS